ncbi:MAG: HEAT repeat domain-containing protein, partial [Parachlamydiaceae bacterium]
STASQALGKILTTGCSITDEAVSQLAKDIKIPDSEYVRANIASALGLIAVNKSSQSQEILTSLSEAIKDRSDTVRSKVVEVLSCIVQQQGAVAESAMAILLTTMQEEKNKHVQWVIFREIGRIIAKNTSLTQKMITQWLDLVSNLLSASYPTLGSKADHEIIIHRTVYNVRKIILPVLLASDSTLGDCQALLDNLKSQPFNCVNWFIQIIALGEVISSGTQIPSSIVDNLIEIWIEKIDIEFYENPTLYEAFCETLVQAVKFQKELSLEATEKLISKGDEGSAHILIAIVKASYCQLEHLVDQIENKLLTILENENKLANIIFDPYNNYILSHAVESGFKLKSQTVLCIIKAFNIKQFNKRLISHFNWIIDKMNLTPYRDFIKINISCPSRSLLSVFKNTPTIDILSNFHHVQRISEVILVRLAKSSLAICIDNTELCFSEDNKFYRVSLPIEFINELQRKLLDRA